MLKNSKSKSQEIKESKEEAEKANLKLMNERKKYIDVSIRGSIMYFILTDLALIDPMYQFSLEKITKLFMFVIERVKEEMVSRHNPIQFLVESLTKYIFTQCSRSIFEEHKLVFSFFVASKIGLREKSINSDEYLFFITGNKPGFDNYRRNPLIWLDDKNWNNICMLESICDKFSTITSDMVKYPDLFKQYIFSENLHEINMPME